MDQKEFREFYRTIQDVAEHPVVLRMKKYPHHGDTSCYKHCMRVAYFNYMQEIASGCKIGGKSRDAA